MTRAGTRTGQGGFASSGAVGRYWLAHCVGFEVSSLDGELSGIVDGVELDRAGRASRLFVQQRLGRTLELGSSSVTAVDPWRRLILVTRPGRKPRSARARTVRTVSTVALRKGWQAASTGAACARAASAAVVVAAGRAAPPSRTFTSWLGLRAAYALEAALWLYAVTVFTITRAAVLLLLAALRCVVRVATWVGPRSARSVRTTIPRVLRHLNADASRSQLLPGDPPRDRAPDDASVREPRRRNPLYR